MAVRTYSNPKVVSPKTVTSLKQGILFEMAATTDDTVVVNELAAVTAAVAFKASDATAVDVTVLGKTITVTEESLTNEKLIVLALG